MTDVPGGGRVDPLQLQVQRRRRRRRVRSLPSLVRQGLAMCWQAGPRDVVLTLGPQLLGAVLLGSLVPLARSVLDAVLGGSTGGATVRAALPLTLLTVIGLLTAVSSAVQAQRARVLGELVQRHVWGRLLDTTTAVELDRFDDPVFFEKLQRVELNALSRPLALAQGLVAFAGGLVGVVAVTVSLLAVQPATLLLLLPAPLALLLTRRGGQLEFDFAVAHTPQLRVRDYLARSLVDRGTAQEVRAYGLAQDLRGRHDTLYDEWIDAVRLHSARRTRLALGSEVVTALVTLMTFAGLLALVDRGALTLAEAGAVGVGAPLLAARLRMAVRGAGQVLESGLFLEDLANFLAQQPAEDPAHVVPELVTLRTRGVSYRYAGASAPALVGVDVELAAGEVVALVGENGSGKTTLAKVLCGLYRPTAGRLEWNGVDTATLDPRGLRRRVAVLFQDFARWHFSGHDNIALGRSGLDTPTTTSVQEAARRSGADQFLSALPAGYATPLSTEVPGGVDLSGGQWQRVALARAVHRDAGLLVLDEPTAALDARAEAELFDAVRSATAGRAVLLITHRLAGVRSCDRIYVLREGRVDDVGTHDQLLERGGYYARLYRLQARGYRTEPDDCKTEPPGTPTL